MDPIAKKEIPQPLQPGAALQTPAQLSAPAGSFFLKSESIRVWIKELPTADIREAGSRLHKTLVEFNRTELPTLVRAEAIELFREPVSHINSSIATQYAETGFPMETGAKEASWLSRELCAEIAVSYKIIIKEQLAAESDEINQKLVVVAANRALESLGEALFYSYLFYSDPNPGIWREIHFFYAWAVQNQVHTIPVKKTRKQSWKQESPCIEDLYKCHLLLASTSPQRLRQSQIRKIHDHLDQWSGLTRLITHEDAFHKTGVFFVVDLGSDDPPSKLSGIDKTKHSDFRAFDLGKLIASLQTDFGKSIWESPTRTETNDQLPSRSLLHLLIHGWTGSVERRFARRSLNHSIYVVPGLDKLHHLLEQEQHPSTQQNDRTVKISALSISNPNFTQKEDVASTLAGAPQRTTAQLLESLGTAVPEPRESFDSDEMLSVLVDDESIGGYRLQLKNVLPPKVRVGDILGIQATGKTVEYRPGIVRWMRYMDDTKLYLGIQIISASCQSARLIPSADSSANENNHFRCLLLGGEGAKNVQPAIISDSREFELNRVLTLTTDSRSHQIMLTDCVESTNRFIRYQFRYLDNAGVC